MDTLMTISTPSDSSWDAGLTDEQRAAACYVGSHMRLLAGPGTGKTHTLTRRVLYLVTEQGVPPSRILCLTFTRVAAYDLRAKIQRHLKPMGLDFPHVSTLHAFALRQLLRNATLIDSLPRPLRIADDWEEKEVIFEDMKVLLNRRVNQVRADFRKLSADWETLRAEEENWRSEFQDAELLGAWEEHRRIYGYTLRSELVYQLKQALVQMPGFLLESGFDHVLIDEYQDLNLCDLAIADWLTLHGAQLLAAGDDDQSIYGFRYAHPSGIRDFLDQFPSATSFELSLCKRCGSRILNFALWVAQQDRDRVAKNLRAAPEQPEGEVHLLSFRRGAEETRAVARICKRLIEKGTPPREILILLRSDHRRAFSRPLHAALEDQGVPVASKASKDSPLDTIAGRRLLALLRLSCNRRDHLAWRTRLKLTPRIGPQAIGSLYERARQNGTTFSEALEHVLLHPNMVDAGIRRVASEARAVLDTLDYVFGETDGSTTDPTRLDADDTVPEQLTERIRNAVERDVQNSAERDTLLAHLIQIAVTSGVGDVSGLLTAIAVGREKLEPELEPDRVNILTMHQAKGLDSDVTFIVAAEDEYLPQSDELVAVADDRRLLYVSMTRARKMLFITYSAQRSGPQMHTGRTGGVQTRHLSRFLRSGPAQVENGEQLANTFASKHDPS